MQNDESNNRAATDCEPTPKPTAKTMSTRRGFLRAGTIALAGGTGLSALSSGADAREKVDSRAAERVRLANSDVAVWNSECPLEHLNSLYAGGATTFHMPNGITLHEWGYVKFVRIVLTVIDPLDGKRIHLAAPTRWADNGFTTITSWTLRGTVTRGGVTIEINQSARGNRHEWIRSVREIPQDQRRPGDPYLKIRDVYIDDDFDFLGLVENIDASATFIPDWPFPIAAML